MKKFENDCIRTNPRYFKLSLLAQERKQKPEFLTKKKCCILSLLYTGDVIKTNQSGQNHFNEEPAQQKTVNQVKT